ncbi:MAG: FxLYD domain-containing protein [Methanoregula sp.]
MPKNEMPSDLMDRLKLQKKKRKKERESRILTVYIGLGLLVLGILVVFAVVASPLLFYFLPMEKTGKTADINIGTSEVPSYSMDSFLESGGFDASADLTILGNELRNDGSHSWVVGRIKNTSNQSLNGCSIYYELYDKVGQPLGSSYTLMSDLPPGAAKGFSTSPLNGIAASAKLKYIIGT